MFTSPPRGSHEPFAGTEKRMPGTTPPPPTEGEKSLYRSSTENEYPLENLSPPLLLKGRVISDRPNATIHVNVFTWTLQPRLYVLFVATVSHTSGCHLLTPETEDAHHPNLRKPGEGRA
ncbi:hypothetical protein, unlikely [Trypanosoma brucei gambiense DAL972]|uniref:Uncharacterized protein n=1 Tax=Trypanosoma brucei gambiense (strain MHOM/CI/86/DAL972) TaxID=679716 RepID=C9ZUE0_TRYB9|nr:hypothetical protein, unlikely [Trypanosoma brucei gambiense DAL972]CBH13027.1 hypothetical protein, unlikely [Trypanosoma brucei gambiense DAL972]|eukprot:XP_011775305.1 hypothetical protein, unlikely [Trypanosoma brucei gambiense DAL972]